MQIVIRHHDGEWQLVCGEHDHPADCSDFEVVGLHHLKERQPNLSLLPFLSPGTCAEWKGDLNEGLWDVTQVGSDDLD